MPSRRPRRGHHGHGGDDLDETGLREPLRYPVSRHVTEIVERRVARVVFDHGDHHASVVETGSRAAHGQDHRGRRRRERPRAQNNAAPPPAGEDPARRHTGTVGGSPERGGEFRCRGKPLVRQRRQRFGDRVLDRSDDAALHPTQRIARFQGPPVVDDPLGEAGHRRLPGQHLEQHAPEAVHVGAGVQIAGAERLLRAHVTG